MISKNTHIFRISIVFIILVSLLFPGIVAAEIPSNESAGLLDNQTLQPASTLNVNDTTPIPTNTTTVATTTITTPATTESPVTTATTITTTVPTTTPAQEPLIAAFTATNYSGTAPLTVVFTDSSSGSPTSWNWSFGDATSSGEQNPHHTYQDAGNFTVSLSVANPSGSNTTELANLIRVFEPEIPVAAHFTSNVTDGMVPLAVRFNDLSTGSPTNWNWSFGDGAFSSEQNPVHTYAAAGNYTVTLAVSNAQSSDNQTVADYISARSATPAYDARIVFSSMPTTMFQGEHYLVDIKVNNTGTETWYADPAGPNPVFLQGLGGTTGDAARFNITHIPMIFANETVAPGESYDFFFYVQAPDAIGNYSPAYQVSSAGSGDFGEISNITVSVIENPFHPVVQPDGSKLYTTTFGNTSAGISVNVVGPKVYLNDLEASGFQDPRYLINPALKSGMFDLDLNESYSYADVSINYDPTKSGTPANLALGYFNTTTGNYTFVPSTVDTTGHTVTARVTPGSPLMSGSAIGAIDAVQYHALPVAAQNEMGYINITTNDNWTIHDTNLGSFSTIWFGNALQYPPGNYTIRASGYYNDAWLGYWWVPCSTGAISADQNSGSLGMQVNYVTAAGSVEIPVSSVRVSSGVLKISHAGGAIGVRNKAYTSSSCCGDVSYQVYYGDGPVTRDGELDYNSELNNDAFDLNQSGYDLAVTAYQAAAGCVLGQAGKKGGYLDSVHSAIPGWSSAINDDVTESTPYMVGQVACNILFPEVTLARDFTADVLRGDPVSAALDSTGFLGPMRAYLGSSNVIPALIAKSPQEVTAGNRVMSDLWRMGIYHTELPAAEKVPMLDKAFDGAATRLEGQGVADNVIAGVYEHNGDISRTLKAGERTDNGKILWLEQGWTEQEAQTAGRNSATGWNHIVEDHIKDGDYADPTKNQFAGAFDPTGTNYRDAESIQNLILDCAKNGKVNPSNTEEYYKKVTDTKAILVIIGNNGYIRTAYPRSISEIPISLT